MKLRLTTSIAALVLAYAAKAQCSINIPQDTVTLYRGYEPLACTTLETEVYGAAPAQFLWSNGSTSATITVCDTASSWYEVTLTDDTLCVASDSVFVKVVDVRCGNNLNKVLVCHVPPGNPANAHTICISANGVPAHLDHGCHLGTCTAEVDSIGSSEEVQLMISPNPLTTSSTVTVLSTVPQRVRVRVVDASGRVYLTLFNADMAGSEQRTLSLGVDQLPENPAFLLIEAQGRAGRATIPVVVER